MDVDQSITCGNVVSFLYAINDTSGKLLKTDKKVQMPNWYLKYFDIAFDRLLVDINLVYKFFTDKKISYKFYNYQYPELDKYLKQVIDLYGDTFLKKSFRGYQVALHMFQIFSKYYDTNMIEQLFEALKIPEKLSGRFPTYYQIHFMKVLQLDHEFKNEEAKQKFSSIMNLINIKYNIN